MASEVAALANKSHELLTHARWQSASEETISIEHGVVCRIRQLRNGFH